MEEDFKVYTINLGSRSRRKKRKISFWGQKIYEGAVPEYGVSAKLYKGMKGKTLLVYALSDEETDYRIVDNLEGAMKAILDIPFKLLEEGYELEGETFKNLKVGYKRLVEQACEVLGIPLIGEDVQVIEF